MIPPITTVASGRCTSAPAPTLNAIGTKPRLATSAVISTGRRRVSAPSRIASSSGLPSSRRLPDEGQHHDAVEHRDADSAMKPTPAEIDSGRPRSSSAATPPVSASGTPEKTIAASFAERNSAIQQAEDQQQRHRHDELQPLGRRDQLLERAAIADPVAGRHLDLGVDLRPAAPRRRSRGRGRARWRSPRRGACRPRG